MKIRKNHFENTVVFELNKKVNELEEILLVNEKEKPFEVIEYTSDFGQTLANDIKTNPHLYKPKSTYNNGINFKELAKLIGLRKWFKKKKKSSIQSIKYYQIDSLFSNSSIFNNSLLINNLKIQKQYKYLFFEYCEAKNMNIELLSVKENLVLLDTIFNLGNDFLKLIEESDTKTP